MVLKKRDCQHTGASVKPILQVRGETTPSSGSLANLILSEISLKKQIPSPFILEQKFSACGHHSFGG